MGTRVRPHAAYVVVALAALLVAAPAAEAKKREHGVDRAKLMKRAERIVEQRNGIEVKRVSRCSPRRVKRKRTKRLDYSRWVCHWRAVGELPGRVPYHCSGKARWTRKHDRWRVDRCVNKMQPYAPLREVPNPHPKFGFNDDWHLHLTRSSVSHTLSVLNRFEQTGADVARMGIYWDTVEPFRGGKQNWIEYDALYVTLVSNGIRPLWVVLGAPCWAQGSCNGSLSPPAPEHVNDFGRFAAAVARRYPLAVGVEVWNEPNYSRFWGGKRPNPDLYGAMLTSAAAHIRERIPTMPVVSGGLSPHGDNDNGAVGFQPYLRRLYELGAAQQADAIGIHPYPGVGPGEDYIANVRIQLGKIQREMGRAGHAAPMWATEYGVSTTGPHAFPAEAQGPALAELYEIFRRVDRVDVAIVHRMIDQPDLQGREAGFGILDQALKAKPALCSIALVRGLLC